MAAFDPDADVDPSDIDPKTRLPHRLILGTLEEQISLLASVLHASEEIEANEGKDGIGADGATGQMRNSARGDWLDPLGATGRNRTCDVAFGGPHDIHFTTVAWHRAF